MKFARFSKDGQVRMGLVDDKAGTIRALSAQVADAGSLIGGHAEPQFDDEQLAFNDVRFLAPFSTAPRNIICVGKNYREHAREFARSGFEAGATTDVDPFPAVFTKPATCIVGPGDKVELHAEVTQAVDYEVELALVIGKAGRGIRKAHAYEHIWGYTIVNDVTARDRQKDHKQWFLGKSLDTFCPMGPWVATADEVDPENLELKCWVNGELRQSANTRDLIFDIPTLIESISAGMGLVPGDIIATGTPAGVGIGFDPPRFLRAGDEVKMSITGLGTLTNTFA